jgi:hypothetical protein
MNLFTASIKDISESTGLTKQAVSKRLYALPHKEIRGIGGRKKIYRTSALPSDYQLALLARQLVRANKGAKNRVIKELINQGERKGGAHNSFLRAKLELATR